jgi:hypothetical protein
MKAFNQIIKPAEFWTPDLNRTKPQPFPGRFPTRWSLLFYEVTKRGNYKIAWQYVGKPNSALVNRIWPFLSKHGSMLLVEFDKGGAFKQTWKNCPRGEFTTQTLNHTLSAFYYPWQPDAVGVAFFAHWAKPGTGSRGIEFGKRRFFVYSPYPKMDDLAGIERLRIYRQWLRRVNPWNGAI